jgi:hypothetical protein
MSSFYIGFAIMLLGGGLYLTQVWQWNPVLAGLGFSVGPEMAGVAALTIGKVRVGPRTLTVVGGLLFVAAAAWWLAALSARTNYPLDYPPGMILTGVGAGVPQTAFLTGGTAHISAEQYSTERGTQHGPADRQRDRRRAYRHGCPLHALPLGVAGDGGYGSGDRLVAGPNRPRKKSKER